MMKKMQMQQQPMQQTAANAAANGGQQQLDPGLAPGPGALVMQTKVDDDERRRRRRWRPACGRLVLWLLLLVVAKMQRVWCVGAGPGKASQ